MKILYAGNIHIDVQTMVGFGVFMPQGELRWFNFQKKVGKKHLKKKRLERALQSVKTPRTTIV
jgi:hypothetical protein